MYRVYNTFLEKAFEKFPLYIIRQIKQMIQKLQFLFYGIVLQENAKNN